MTSKPGGKLNHAMGLCVCGNFTSGIRFGGYRFQGRGQLKVEQDPGRGSYSMPLALVIAIPALLIALCVSLAYERDICASMLDWLQERESKRVRLSRSAIGRPRKL
jgi:hypothetical protein